MNYLENNNYFWKNFKLGTELHIAGNFIYDALYDIDQLEYFNYADECFNILYKLSIGIERLEKIAIILLEHNNKINQEELKKSLITHNHIDLIGRIIKKHKLSLGKPHTKFLNLLSTFYKSTRYDRYNPDSAYRPNQDQFQLVDYIQKSLDINIDYKSIIFPTEVNGKIKNFLGRVIIKITDQLYTIISEASTKLNMYTYEIRYGSKAFKIFISKEINFEREHMLQSEILIFLLNRTNSDFHKYIKEIDALNFDEGDIYSYIKSLLNIHRSYETIGDMDVLYKEQNKYSKERHDFLTAIEKGNIYFGEIPEDEWLL